jgi:hypothetical protein
MLELPIWRRSTGAMLPRLCFVMLFAVCAPVTLSTARADTTPTQRVEATPIRQACIGWTWSHLFAPVERVMGNQTNMIRFGVIALFAAMYIIWWRK